MTTSGGILPYRQTPEGRLQVLIAHPGGPLWARKDEGAWSVIKGELEPDEHPLDAAVREFTEETGWRLPAGTYLDLGRVEQKSGKVVVAWAVEADFDPDTLRPGTFTMEWPPRSGQTREFPEIDRVAWFDLDEAARRLNPAQRAFLDRLRHALQDPQSARSDTVVP